jgi:hypothetical protein
MKAKKTKKEPVKKRLFYHINENNDWEGEDWNFYLVQEGNELFIERLKEAIAKFDEYGETLEISDKLVSEKEVDTLVKHSKSGYMAYYNKVDKVISPDVIEMDSMEDFFQCINKGGLFH